MKANDLRTGNWYLSTKFQVPVICGVDDFYEIYARADGGAEYTVDDIFQPLPLTEEWLLKFGFVKDKQSFAMGVHDRLFSGLMKFKFDRLLQMWVFSIGTIKDITRVEYVHQLQNLYFALTGEELIIK